MNGKKKSLPRFGAMIAVSLLTITPAVFAQQPAPSQSMPGMNSAHKAMMEGMQKMNQDMVTVPATGDPDKDFVAMMIPHHQGAIDMAKVELAQGKDLTIRKMARDIVAAQQREIKQMTDWQKKHASKP